MLYKNRDLPGTGMFENLFSYSFYQLTLSGVATSEQLQWSSTALLPISAFCEVLRKNGYSVLPASNGREALRLVREHAEPIDLVITDMVMPQMGGRELAEALRSLQPHTKILYMSGYAERAEDVKELVCRGHAFIEKPFTPEELLHKMRDVLLIEPLRSCG